MAVTSLPLAPAPAAGALDWLLRGQRDWTVRLPVVDLVLTGRAVFLAATAVTVLLVAGVAVAASGRAELRRRWSTWAIIIPVVGIPIWAGKGTTALLAGALAVQAVRELARLVGLPRPETVLLVVAAVAYPLAAWLRPGLLALAPVVVLVCALPAVLAGDVAGGLRRASLTGFASVWICWSLAHLVVLWHDAFLIAFAASAADVAAWCAGARGCGACRGPVGPCLLCPPTRPWVAWWGRCSVARWCWRSLAA